MDENAFVREECSFWFCCRWSLYWVKCSSSLSVIWMFSLDCACDDSKLGSKDCFACCLSTNYPTDPYNILKLCQEANVALHDSIQYLRKKDWYNCPIKYIDYIFSKHHPYSVFFRLLLHAASDILYLDLMMLFVQVRDSYLRYCSLVLCYIGYIWLLILESISSY